MNISAKLQKALDGHVPKKEQSAFVEKAVKMELDKQIAMKANRVKIYVDGGSRGNPGPSGGGFAIYPPDGSPIQGSEFYGNKTNNQSEYLALRSALREAYMLFPEANIDCFMDSELVVKQMQGHYKVKNPELRLIYEEVSRIAEQFNSFKISHVRREQNTVADRLANEAMDLGH